MLNDGLLFICPLHVVCMSVCVRTIKMQLCRNVCRKNIQAIQFAVKVLVNVKMGGTANVLHTSASFQNPSACVNTLITTCILF